MENSKIYAKKLFYLVLLLMPVGLNGIGIIDDKSMTNISLSDFLLIPLVLYIFFNYRAFRCKNKISEVLSFRYICYVVIFLGIILISMLNLIRFSGDIVLSLFNSLKLLICFLYGFTFLIYLRNCNQKDWEKFIIVAMSSGLIFSVACIVGAILFFGGYDNVFIDYYIDSFRANGFQDDPNTAAIFQIMTISYGLMCLHITKYKGLTYLSLAIMFFGVLTTVSKSSIITMIITLFLILGISLVAGMKETVRKIILFLILSVIFFLYLLITTNYLDFLIYRINDFFSGDAAVVMTGRNYQWNAAYDILVENPLNFIFGIGIAQFEYVANQYGLQTVSYAVHNTFLSFMVECGIMGFFIIFFLILYINVILGRNIIKKKDKFSLISLWGVASIFIFMNSLNFQNNRMAYVFLTFVYISYHRLKREELKF